MMRRKEDDEFTSRKEKVRPVVTEKWYSFYNRCDNFPLDSYEKHEIVKSYSQVKQEKIFDKIHHPGSVLYIITLINMYLWNI